MWAYILEVQADAATRPVLAQVSVPKAAGWREVRVPLAAFQPGTHHLVVASQTAAPVEIDWIRFE